MRDVGGRIVRSFGLVANIHERKRTERRLHRAMRACYEAVLAERSRIARELHDTLLQGFTGITIQLRAIQRVLSRRPEEGAGTLETVLTSADTALRDARNAIWREKYKCDSSMPRSSWFWRWRMMAQEFLRGRRRPASDGHLGIAGMRNRANRAGGTIQIASQQGAGTTIRVTWPIE